MTADFPPPLRPTVQVQADALRAAFPSYVINVIVLSRGELPRFEVVNRHGGNPYCLISSDAREIWRELRGQEDREQGQVACRDDPGES